MWNLCLANEQASHSPSSPSGENLKVSRSTIFICSANRQSFLFMFLCFRSWGLVFKTLSAIPVPLLSIPLKHLTSDQGQAKAEKEELLSSHTLLFHCQAFTDPHPECNWSVWCLHAERLSAWPLSRTRIRHPSENGSNKWGLGTGETQDCNKLLRHFLLRATQMGRWGCSFKCVPVQPWALNPDDRLQAFSCCSFHQRWNVDSLVRRAASQGETH